MNNKSNAKLNIPKDVLFQKYIVEKKQMHVIANELGVSVGSVHKYIRRYGITSRRSTDYPITEKQREAGRRASQARKGMHASEETRAKMSEARQNRGIGHRKKRTDGYISIYFPDHPMSSKDGYILEHTLVMEAVIGRHLKPDECVHHINKDRSDNRAINLRLMTRSEHTSLHARERADEKRRNDLSTS